MDDKTYDPVAAAAGHAFRGGTWTPGWCVRCGGAEFVHEGQS